ncbi:hypothetical protein PIB30_027314 [Stylosanthes scabra]|uniref:C2H2-type domain-containing protein n=1 Tax=Stylosanthes scabra TaxID=79078 RepID=A0ABU6ZB64_9FABA|nr:hypothetical protein [Stylosanthes scabra]
MMMLSSSEAFSSAPPTSPSSSLLHQVHDPNPNNNPNPNSKPVKRKRTQPGRPDPEAEVIALSPKSLMATNRFVCEICKKGFQRDQNLQLHRRGHNLPWKLKQRDKDELLRKKVYVCPEKTCVHHHASRALGDFTGIKKHFSRKHGEKKWKCEKCSKKYAVQSDWKAHSKICGTREYRCHCGTLFSRKDSFLTHRAFCQALPTPNNYNGLIGGSVSMAVAEAPSSSLWFDQTMNVLGSPSPWMNNNNNVLVLKREEEEKLYSASSWSSTFVGHMSATALLQKATQMESITSMVSNNNNNALGFMLSSSSSQPNSIGCGAAFSSFNSNSSNLLLQHHYSNHEQDHLGLGLTRDFLGVGGFTKFINHPMMASHHSLLTLPTNPPHHHFTPLPPHQE